MIRRPTGHLGIDPTEPQPGKIESIDKDVDHPNGIILANPVSQAFGKQRALPAIQPLNEALHPIPRKSRENHISGISPIEPFSHSQGQKRCFNWRPVTSGLPRSTDILSQFRHATAAEPGGGGCDRIEGQCLGSDAITSPASASSRQGVTVNGSRSDHSATQRYMAFGSFDSEIANPLTVHAMPTPQHLDALGRCTTRF